MTKQGLVWFSCANQENKNQIKDLFVSSSLRKKGINFILYDIQVNKRPKLLKFTTPQRESNRLLLLLFEWHFYSEKLISIIGCSFLIEWFVCWSGEFEYFSLFFPSFLGDGFVAVVRIGLVGIGVRIINELRYFKCNNHLVPLMVQHELRGDFNM